MSFLWTDKRDGRPSKAKFWTNIAYGVATYVIVVNAVHLAWDLFLVYLGVVGGSELAGTLIKAKYPIDKCPVVPPDDRKDSK